MSDMMKQFMQDKYPFFANIFSTQKEYTFAKINGITACFKMQPLCPALNQWNANLVDLGLFQ